MFLTVTGLGSQLALRPREILSLDRNMSRLYHYHTRHSSCANVRLLGKHLSSSSFVVGTWKVPRTCHDSLRIVPSTRRITSQGFSGNLTKQQAKELAVKLTSEERDIFLNALNECKSNEEKIGFEGQLAAFRWKSKFGRPSNAPTLGDVDPTGSYCTVPDNWLLRKYVETVPEPSKKDLSIVALSNALPFIAFGFLDNFIMIVAGDQIEMAFNMRFPISTMTAAALGNTVSDVIGIGSVHYVERLIMKVGLESPKLSPIQSKLPKTRVATNVGRVIGVTIGCLLGMIPIPIFSLLHGAS